MYAPHGVHAESFAVRDTARTRQGWSASHETAVIKAVGYWRPWVRILAEPASWTGISGG